MVNHSAVVHQISSFPLFGNVHGPLEWLLLVMKGIFNLIYVASVRVPNRTWPLKHDGYIDCNIPTPNLATLPTPTPFSTRSTTMSQTPKLPQREPSVIASFVLPANHSNPMVPFSSYCRQRSREYGTRWIPPVTKDTLWTISTV